MKTKRMGNYKRVEKGIVYKITCVPNGRVYVGQTKKGIQSRIYNHFWKARKAAVGLYPLNHLYSDIIQYGEINFDIDILEVGCNDDFRRVELETKHILKLKEEGVPLYNKVDYMSPARQSEKAMKESKRSEKMKALRAVKSWNPKSSILDDLNDI